MPSQIRTIADLAFSMDGVLKLHFGESNTQTPQYLKDAAYQALNDGYTFYKEFITTGQSHRQFCNSVHVKTRLSLFSPFQKPTV
jgi:hypothetical protein